MLLSICIPNYNRKKHLNNCLNSILISQKKSRIKFEVCISDNCSEDNIEEIVSNYKKFLAIKFKKNKKNFGLGRNIVESVSMASGEYVWILGNDDLVLPKTLEKLDKLFHKFNDVDFFFINSFNLKSSEILKFPQPFDTKNLPNIMKKFSSVKSDKSVSFQELIDPNISFDYLLGIFLSIFKRKMWNESVQSINKTNLNNDKVFSTFENTCPHIIIFGKSFMKSKAFIQSEPLSVNLSGEREWSNLYSFIEAIRIPEILEIYSKFGLSKKRYFYCKNHSLKNFLPSLTKIIFNGKKSGLNYIKLIPHIFKNMIYPNFYLSPLRYIIKKIFLNN